MLKPMTGRALLGCALAAVGLAIAGPTLPARADSIRDLEWYLTSLRMPEAWALSRGDGVVVAILETGTVDTSQPDLAGAVLPGVDLTGVGEVADHATTIAALIAARGRGDAGVIGLAPGAMILPVVTNDAASMAAGFRWATDNGAGIINCSCSLGLGAAPAVRDAIGYALDHDVVVVAAAGNSSGPVEVPASFAGVIAVSGITQQDGLTDVSSYGPEVDMAAPASDVPVAVLDGEYLGTNGGTSGAAALLSGVVALVRAEYPDLGAADVVNRVVSTARDIGPAGLDDEFGYGAVDPVAALTAAVAPVDANPLGSPGDSPGEGAPAEPADTDSSVSPPAVGATPPDDGRCPTADAGVPAESASATEPFAPLETPAPAAPATPRAAGSTGEPADSAQQELVEASGEDCDPVLITSSNSADTAGSGVLIAVGAGAVLLLAAAGAAVFVRRRRTT